MLPIKSYLNIFSVWGKNAIHRNNPKKPGRPKQMLLLTPELENVAEKNCNETAERRKTSLASLKSWLRKTPHLKSRTNDELLLSFLRSSRYSLEETKNRIDGYYSLKSIFPEVLTQRVIDEKLMSLYRQGVHTVSIKPLCPNGPRILVSQFSKYDPKKCHPRDVLKLLFMLLEVLANEDPNTSVCGLVYVLDGRDMTIEQMLQYDPILIKKTLTLVENFMPIRFTELHLINMRKEGQAILNLLTTFLPEILPVKFIIHNKAENLYDHLPRDCMIVEYGGSNGYQAEALKHWENVMMKYKDYFANDDQYGTKEKLRCRITSSLEVSQLSGLNGSFRKLEVD